MNEYNNDELMHYGVLGMKWGVRRASKKLANAKTTKQYNSAMKSLDKHQAKSSKQLSRLEKAAPKLQSAVNRSIAKTDIKVAQLNGQAARYKQKAYKRFVGTERSMRYLKKAHRLEATASSLAAKSSENKAKLERNKYLQETYRKGISDIDAAKLNSGKKYAELLLKERNA